MLNAQVKTEVGDKLEFAPEIDGRNRVTGRTILKLTKKDLTFDFPMTYDEMYELKQVLSLLL